MRVTEMYTDEMQPFVKSMVEVVKDITYGSAAPAPISREEGIRLHAMMITHWRDYGLLTKYTQIAKEATFEQPISIRVNGVEINGVPDVITKHEIIDYKCGNMYEPRYLFQLEMYAYMMHLLGRKICRVILFNPRTNHLIKMRLKGNFVSSFKKQLAQWLRS